MLSCYPNCSLILNFRICKSHAMYLLNPASVLSHLFSSCKQFLNALSRPYHLQKLGTHLLDRITKPRIILNHRSGNPSMLPPIPCSLSPWLFADGERDGGCWDWIVEEDGRRCTDGKMVSLFAMESVREDGMKREDGKAVSLFGMGSVVRVPGYDPVSPEAANRNILHPTKQTSCSRIAVF